MIDKNFKLFGKVSIVDIVIICIVLAAFFFIYRLSSPQTALAKPTDKKIEYTVELFKKEPGFEKNIAVGEKIYDNLKNHEIGTIVDISTAPYMESIPDFDANVFRMAEVKPFINVNVVVSASAQVTDESIMVGQYEVLINKNVPFGGKMFGSLGIVSRIEIVE